MSFQQPAASPVSQLELLHRLEAAEAELASLRRESAVVQAAATTALPASMMQIQAAPGNVGSDDDTELRIDALEKSAAAAKEKLPLIRLSGFFQIDQAFVDQSDNNRNIFGDVFNGVGFRRARLQALGNVTEFTRYSIEFDFAVDWPAQLHGRVGRANQLAVLREHSHRPLSPADHDGRA